MKTMRIAQEIEPDKKICLSCNKAIEAFMFKIVPQPAKSETLAEVKNREDAMVLKIIDPRDRSFFIVLLAFNSETFVTLTFYNACQRDSIQ